MTEKRFTFYHDNVALNLKTPICDNGRKLSIGEVLDEMNKLNEVIMHLKYENKTWLKTAYHLDTIHHEDREYCERLSEENEQLKYLLKHSCVTEICENCKYNEYSKYEDCFGIEYDSKCLKGLWKDETHECDGFELKSIEELAKDLRIDFND